MLGGFDQSFDLDADPITAGSGRV